MKKLQETKFSGWAVVDKDTGNLAVFGCWVKIASAVHSSAHGPEPQVAGTTVVPVTVTVQPAKKTRKKVRA